MFFPLHFDVESDMMDTAKRTHKVRKDSNMNHASRIFILILAVMLCVAGSAMASQTYTISEEEYNLLQMYKRLEEIKMIIDAEFLWEYDEERLLEGAAQGMLGVLGDDYTYYTLPADADSEAEVITGTYCGIGVAVFAASNDNLITIHRVFPGGPAKKAGLQVGDKIIAIDGTEFSGFELNDAVAIMRGEQGGEVKLLVLRGEEILEFVCVRDFVETEILTSEVLEENIGYIRVYEFEGNAIPQFAAVIQDFLVKDIQGLVIDLRGNPGGLVHLALQMADVFIEDGQLMATEDKHGRVLPDYAIKGAWNLPIVVLVDAQSASCSEIFAAALRENGVATIVGTQTFGKGIVQTVHTFDDGAGVHITSGYWLTPEGNKIHKEGITPDVVVELEEDSLDENYEIIREKDTQLQKALEIIKEKLKAQ